MNLLLENGQITEMSCGENFSYILEENSMFSPTEYKVLQNTGYLVKCIKMLYNGKVQLYYFNEGLKSFSSVFSTLNEENFLTMVSNLISGVVEVKNNGFLSCKNIDISFDHIFVDPTNYEVVLVYLPITEGLFDSYSTFENELRTSLLKLIDKNTTFSSARMERLISDLSNGTVYLEDLSKRLKGGVISHSVAGTAGKKEVSRQKYNSNYSHESTTNSKCAKLIAIDAPMRVEISITKDEFVIGKKAESVDGVVSFNKLISRVHCKINKEGSDYFITDLGSANGTYVNKKRINPKQAVQIKNADIVRMANSDFKVIIE